MGITSLFKLLYLLFGRCGLFTAFSLYDFTQLAAVGSDQILFQRAGFELHHNIVVIGRNQTVTSFKVSDLHCFSIGQVQGFLYPLGFVVLQIQNDLGLGVVDDALTKSAAVKVKEIGKIQIRLSQARLSSTVRPEREKFMSSKATEAVTMAAIVEMARIWVYTSCMISLALVHTSVAA